jgi:dihydropteroate synthase
MSAARATAARPPAASRLRLGARDIDLAGRALVIGMVDASAPDVVACSRDQRAAGADLVELMGVSGAALAPAVAALRRGLDAPIAVRTDDADALRSALDAGAVMAHATAPPAREYLGVAMRFGAAAVFVDPSGAAARHASTCGLGCDQIVIEAGAGATSDEAVATELASVARLVRRGCPVAWNATRAGGAEVVVAVAWAVALGARIVFAHDVEPAVRVVRTIAAIARGSAP